MATKDITLYQDNRITQARYEFTKIEKRIIYLIVNEIRKKYVTPEDANKNLFGNMVVSLTHSQLKVASDDSDLVYKSIRKLISKFYEFDDENEWMILGVINKAKHKKKDAVWEVTVDQDMVGKFVELAKNYTAYSLMVAMSLRSEYSQRLYEYCSQFRNAGGWKTSVRDLRFKMKLEEKYSRYASFKKRVLDVAKKELKTMYENGQSDLYFEYSETKNGRTVTDLSFKIIDKKGMVEMPLTDVDYFVRTTLKTLFEVKKKPKNGLFIDELMVTLRLEPELLKHCYGKLEWVKNSIPKSEQQRYMRFIINEEYLKS
jgi:plasmid replication initiation protein|tara:strand:- start:3937 stop:4881 length:945 start_codon:yes stop_codon:yes gene_type:complete